MSVLDNITIEPIKWNMEKMYHLQEQLDNVIRENNGKTPEEDFNSRKMGALVELYEVLMEKEELYKEWKQNTDTADEAKILEEIADLLHFLISLGVDKGTNPLHKNIITIDHPIEHIMGLNASMLKITRDDYQKDIETSIGLLRGLFIRLGYSHEEIEREYERKNKINLERQATGY